MTRAEELRAVILEKKRELADLESALLREFIALAEEECEFRIGDELEAILTTTRGPITLCYLLEKIEPIANHKPLLRGRRILGDGSIGKGPRRYIWGAVKKVGHRDLGEETA